MSSRKPGHRQGPQAYQPGRCLQTPGCGRSPTGKPLGRPVVSCAEPGLSPAKGALRRAIVQPRESRSHCGPPPAPTPKPSDRPGRSPGNRRALLYMVLKAVSTRDWRLSRRRHASRLSGRAGVLHLGSLRWCTVLAASAAVC